MHHPTDRIAHTTVFVTPVVEHWLERELAQWVHPMKDRSNDPLHHERTLLPRSYISLWMEREIAQWVHPMKDRSDDPSHHERTLLPRSYMSLPGQPGSKSVVLTHNYGPCSLKHLNVQKAPCICIILAYTANKTPKKALERFLPPSSYFIPDL